MLAYGHSVALLRLYTKDGGSGGEDDDVRVMLWECFRLCTFIVTG